MADHIGDRAVYVLGAGFTKAFLPDAPLRVDDFDGNGLEQKFATFRVALELIQLERRRNECGKIDIERLMSRLDGGMPFDSEIDDSQVRLLLAEVKRRFFRSNPRRTRWPSGSRPARARRTPLHRSAGWYRHV